jgi:uncharacterized protein YprB with RNaseH-like and TPR domain
MTMSELEKRLDLLFRRGLVRKGIDPRDRIPRRKRSGPVTPPGEFEGREVGDGDNRCVRYEHTFSPDTVYGLGTPVGTLLADGPDALRPAIVQGDPLARRESLLFLDTETTGLAMGTGTYAFLVGIGFFDPEGFRVVQFFMRDFSEEEALLEALEDASATFHQIVTYNGRVFDLELLRNRYRMAGAIPPFEDRKNLDLLFLCRRFYRDRLENCRLTTLEREVLDVHRKGDIDGALIPSLYFHFLRTGEFPEFDRILVHNVQDVVSLAYLTHLFAQSLQDPFGTADLHGGVFLGIGSLIEEGGLLDVGLVERCYREAMRRGLGCGEGYEAARRLSLRRRREKDYERASEIWQEMIEHRAPRDIFPLIEMAKHYEHRRGEYAKAIDLVREAMSSLRANVDLPGESPRQQEELLHRLARLERRRRHESPG